MRIFVTISAGLIPVSTYWIANGPFVRGGQLASVWLFSILFASFAWLWPGWKSK